MLGMSGHLFILSLYEEECAEMKLADIVKFRKDLLFDGAVQLGWFENNQELAVRAAEHFVFHGPQYHGVREDDLDSSSYSLVDTATFALDIFKRITGENPDEPFTMAIAGYGTGKSHLALTLACLLSDPASHVSEKILANLTMADEEIGKQAKELLQSSNQPYIVVALNGMADFDLGAEIIRQILQLLNRKGIDTSALENLRPRFKQAINFTKSFYDTLANEYAEEFGTTCDVETIVEELKCQNEEVFRKVSRIYEKKMGSPIQAVGQESLHDFIQVVKQTYCGPGKPFAGVVILFDEFGRYLEFSVQKPHVAGSGALQQLFECVQANSDGVFLLCFIQYELKAYISRVAPELREDLSRYVTRYDSLRKVRLSTNLETLIANLFEKKDKVVLEKQLENTGFESNLVQTLMRKWFPDLENHALWVDEDRFNRTILEGCWPLHPCSTWALYKLTSVGRSLQQRSSLSLLAEIFQEVENKEIALGYTIFPVDLCNQTLINEFLASEYYGQQGATANSYESVLQKYQYELTDEEKLVLKAVLLSAKIGLKAESKQSYFQAIAVFCGREIEKIEIAVDSLENEYAVLEWNDLLNQYEIVDDAVPKRKFLAQLAAKADEYDLATRAEIFAQKSMPWEIIPQIYNTDFGPENMISTKEWNYRIHTCHFDILEVQIEYAVRTWLDSIEVDKEKGQLIYCYVGSESNLEVVKDNAFEKLQSIMQKNNLDLAIGAPIAVLFLHDVDGTFGQRLAEYAVLDELMNDAEYDRYKNFMNDRKNNLEQEIRNQVTDLQRAMQIIFATDKEVSGSKLKQKLTNLFDIVYPLRVPFPFDGFHTSRGNAAKDCQLFTIDLFKGNVDHEWITARPPQQRNRANSVLVDAWRIIGKDGLIRQIPGNQEVRGIIELLDSKLDTEDGESSQPLNMGEVLKLLCSPPYGCNIASAGLLLAYFVGSKKDVQLLQDNQSINIDRWLQNAMVGNFLSPPVLESTEIIKISGESISEWQKFLDEWDLETTLIGKQKYYLEEEELRNRIPVPLELFWKLEINRKETMEALEELNEFYKEFNDALEKVQNGIEKDSFPQISWGAAQLAELYRKMEEEPEKWSDKQMEEVAEKLAEARSETKLRFDDWLPSQKVYHIRQLEKFKDKMRYQIGENLKKLGFDEEREKLEKHVELVEQNVEFLAELERAISDVDAMISANAITDMTKISALHDWLKQAEKLNERLKKARMHRRLAQDDINNAVKRLEDFILACEKQLESYQDRAAEIYNVREINSLSDIANWRNEVANLIQIFEGQDRDVEDLMSVQKQLELIEDHYKLLDNTSLGSEEFERLCGQLRDENDLAFVDDSPPLDNEFIYQSIKESISIKRKQIADEWMKNTVPKLEAIEKFDASTAHSYMTRLNSMPPVLSEHQRGIAQQAIEACEKRLELLEVEGALALFERLSKENKMLFLKRIINEIKDFYVNYAKSS